MDFEKMREAAIAELEGFRVLEESTDAAERQRAAFIAAALNTLPQQEQEILRQFFIDRRCPLCGTSGKTASNVWVEPVGALQAKERSNNKLLHGGACYSRSYEQEKRITPPSLTGKRGYFFSVQSERLTPNTSSVTKMFGLGCNGGAEGN